MFQSDNKKDRVQNLSLQGVSTRVFWGEAQVLRFKLLGSYNSEVKY